MSGALVEWLRRKGKRGKASRVDASRVDPFLYQRRSMNTYWSPISHPLVSRDLAVPVRIRRQGARAAVSSDVSANTERKKRTIYFPTLDYAPVSENKKVRFSRLHVSMRERTRMRTRRTQKANNLVSDSFGKAKRSVFKNTRFESKLSMRERMRMRTRRSRR